MKLSIEQKIYELRNEFIFEHRVEPNALFVFHDDYYELVKNRFVIDLDLDGSLSKFMGMNIIRSNTNETFVGLVTTKETVKQFDFYPPGKYINYIV